VIAAICRRVAIVIFAVLFWGALPLPTASAQPPKQQQTEYTPIKDLPPQEQLPAARLLVGAYSFVIVGLFLYVVSVARRLTAVQREVERLEVDVKRTGRG
jgi:CcmD family protein